MTALATLLSIDLCAPLAIAFIQDVETVPMPSQALPLSSPVLGYAIMAIFGAAFIGASLMPSKRGHQD